MNKALLVVPFLWVSAAAASYPMSLPETVLRGIGEVSKVTPPRDTLVSWRIRTVAQNDAVAYYHVHISRSAKIAVPAIIIEWKGTAATSAGLSSFVPGAQELASYCFGNTHARYTEYGEWLRTKSSEALNNRGGTYTRKFGPMEAEVSVWQTGDQITLRVSARREGTPGNTAWPQYCTPR